MEIVTTRATRPKRSSIRGWLGMLGFAVLIASLMVWGSWDATDEYNAIIQILLLGVLARSYIWVYFWGRGRQEDLIAAAEARIEAMILEASQTTSERE